MERLNYGLAMSSNGDFQVIDTYYGPGISDCWSTTRNETFLFLVAPHDYVDNFLKTHYETDYIKNRKFLQEKYPLSYYFAIRSYFGLSNDVSVRAHE